MIPILDYEVNDFGDVVCFVEGPIHIIDRDGPGVEVIVLVQCLAMR